MPHSSNSTDGIRQALLMSLLISSFFRSCYCSNEPNSLCRKDGEDRLLEPMDKGCFGAVMYGSSSVNEEELLSFDEEV